MQSEDAGRIRAQIAELQQAMMVLGQAAYGGATATGPGALSARVAMGMASRTVRFHSRPASGMNSRVRCDSSGARWRVTDDDLTQLSGKTEELAGVLQQRYGYSKKRN